MALSGYTAKVVNGVVRWYDANGVEVPVATVRASVTSTSAATAERNRRDLLTKAAAALSSNATYLALGSPTAAQNTAQIRALTRQNNALIRLLTKALDTTTGT